MSACSKEQMSRADVIARLRELDEEARQIRRTFGISDPGQQLAWAGGLNADEAYFAVADGYGGATFRYVEGAGTGADNEMEKFSHDFSTESAAGRFLGIVDGNYVNVYANWEPDCNRCASDIEIQGDGTARCPECGLISEDGYEEDEAEDNES